MFSFAPILGVYFLIGLIFGIAFITKGCVVVEPAVKGSGFRVRLLLLPGAIGLWPLLLMKWISGRRVT